MKSKAPLECALATLRACKEAFKNYSRVTMFVFDHTLQKLIMSKQRHVHFKNVPFN